MLDTHIWFWYLIGSDRIPNRFIEIISNNKPKCWYSPISVWELSVLKRKNRIQIKGSFREWITESLRLFPLNEAPVNMEITIAAEELEFRHPDPADHIIAATAHVYDLSLLTVDSRLVELDWLKTIEG